MTKKRNHDRAPGQTAISFSCPEEMKAQLTKMADAEMRTLSNYLQIVLKEHIKRMTKHGSVA